MRFICLFLFGLPSMLFGYIYHVIRRGFEVGIEIARESFDA